MAFLQRRRVAQPAAGEWLAYMKFRREAFIKGPVDKPYLPSIHMLRGGVPEEEPSMKEMPNSKK